MIDKKTIYALSKQIDAIKCSQCQCDFGLEDFFEHAEECKGQPMVPINPTLEDQSNINSPIKKGKQLHRMNSSNEKYKGMFHKPQGVSGDNFMDEDCSTEAGLRSNFQLQ